MESIDLEYANAVAKHRQADKGRRPTPIVFSPYANPPSGNNNSNTTSMPLSAGGVNNGTLMSMLSSPNNPGAKDDPTSTSNRRLSISERGGLHSPVSSTASSAASPGFMFSPTFSGSNLAPSVSKLRRTSQFFTKLTHSLVKSHQTTSSTSVGNPPLSATSRSEYLRSGRNTGGSIQGPRSFTAIGGPHHLEIPLGDGHPGDFASSPLMRSRSEYDPSTSSMSPHIALYESNTGAPPDLRRDSMYSIRTSATAPASNGSCPESPGGDFRKDASSGHYSLPDDTSDRTGEEQQSFLSALRSFNQLHSDALSDGRTSNDFQQLREALHNFKISDKGDYSESTTDEGQRKDSLSTTFTGETSGSEPETAFPPEAILGEALYSAMLTNKRRPSQTSSLIARSILPTVVAIQPINDNDDEEEEEGDEELALNGETSPPTMAKRLFSNDQRVLAHDEIAEYLGKRGDYYSQVLREYMNHFSFSNLRLDEAFRSLCAHLYLHGETQVIDRILAEFARRYWDCNPNSVFRSQDVVYAVSYSILLLNTDLHVAKNHNKMSRSDFVKNTLSAVDSCNRAASFEATDSTLPRPNPVNYDEITQTLKEMYSSIKHNQILQQTEPRGRRRPSSTSSPTLTPGSSLYRARSVSKLKQGPSTSSKKQMSWELQRQKSGNSLSLSQMSSRSGTPDLFFNSSNNRPPAPQPPAGNAKVNPTEAAVYPYHMMGILVRKHLYERTDKKAPHRTWKECMVTVKHGEIHMSKADKMGGQDSMSDPSNLLGVVSLRHCLAVILPPPGYNPSRPHVFALQLPSGGVYLFQAAAADQVASWVVICNFWAARESKEPLPGGICSIDYGWGTTYGSNIDQDPSQIDEEDEGEDEVARLPGPDSYQPVSSRQLFSDAHPQPPRTPPTIQEWRPPALPTVRSILGEDAQLEALLRQIAALDNELVEHMELRGTIHRRMPPRSPHYAKAFSNWERKSQYLLRELIKYQNYADVLKRTLAANRGLAHPDDLLLEEDDDSNDNAPDDSIIEEVTEFVPVSDPSAPSPPPTIHNNDVEFSPVTL